MEVSLLSLLLLSITSDERLFQSFPSRMDSKQEPVKEQAPDMRLVFLAGFYLLDK